MRQHVAKAKKVRIALICIVLLGFGSLVLFDAASHFSYYLNSTETFGEVSSRDYLDSNKERYDITITYKDQNGEEHSIQKKNLLAKLVDYPMYSDIYMFYDSKHPEVADMETRNIYVMGIIILVCYAISVGLIINIIKESKECKRVNALIDKDNMIMADFVDTSIKRRKNDVKYIVHASTVKDGKTYEFYSLPVMNDPEKMIVKKLENKVNVYVDENDYSNYVVDISEF